MAVKKAKTQASKAQRGRQSKNVEFLKTLQALTDLTQKDFAKACGKKAPNMSKHLAGKLPPGKRVLVSCVRHLSKYLFEWAVNPIMELQPIPHLNSLPVTAGLYILFDSTGSILYVGKATNFRAEVKQTLGRPLRVAPRFGSMLSNGKPILKKGKHLIREVASRLSLYEISSPRLRHNFEAMFLRVVANQTHNKNIGNFK